MSLEKLTQVCGVSGYEREVRDMVWEMAAPYADEILVDALGNLIVSRNGRGTSRKRIMLAAHMDEIGLQVTKIEEKGLLRVKMLGSVWIPTVYMSRVRFRSGLTGIVSASVRPDDIKNDFTKLYVDIGAKSREEAERHVKLGDVACHVGEWQELLNRFVAVKALDDRVGCHILLETLKRMETPHHDISFVFTVQEEVGCRGSKVAAERIRPDIGIAVDVTPAHDHPGDLEGSNTLGAGVAVKISDTSVICDEALVEDMICFCTDNGIAFQRDVIYVGGTDASSMNLSHMGVRVAGVSVPTRYTHGPNAIVSLDDVDCAIRLLSGWLVKKEL
jgi:endoglucanase